MGVSSYEIVLDDLKGYQALKRSAKTVIQKDLLSLWNGCHPIGLVVLMSEGFPKELTKDRVTTMVRSRLRAARVYSDIFGPYLSVTLSSSTIAVVTNIAFIRPVNTIKVRNLDYVLGNAETFSVKGAFSVPTWERMTGGHYQTTEVILSRISELTDEFIDEYLRVNAEACQ